MVVVTSSSWSGSSSRSCFSGQQWSAGRFRPVVRIRIEMQHCFIGLTDSLHVWIWSTAADRSLPEAVKDRTTTTRQGKPRQLRCPTRSVVLWPPPGPPSAFGSRKSIILFAGAGLFVRSFLVRIKARANQAIRHLTYCVLLQMIGWRSDHSEGQNAGKSPEQSLASSVARTFFCRLEMVKNSELLLCEWRREF